MYTHKISLTAQTESAFLINQSDQFASALAHEVRNPLTNIKLSGEILNSVIKDKALKTYVDIIMRSSKKIEVLINELLAVKPHNLIRREKYSLHQLLDEVLEMTEDRARLKNISVKKNLATEDCKIIMNRPKMKIALANIVINAIESMGAGDGELNLVTKSIDDRHVVLIKDNGCGISQGNLKKIFKPYFSNKPNGLGIGLTRTQEILESNNVRVNVESEVGKGTSFILLFDKKEND
jgi:signal transduction histidine kinase